MVPPSLLSYQGCVQEGLSACSTAGVDHMGPAAFACLPLQPRAHPTEPQCHLATMAPTDRKGAVGWQRQDPVSCSSCLAPTLPHGVIPPPPSLSLLLGHLVPQGLEILPSVSACLSTPARDPRPLRQE